MRMTNETKYLTEAQHLAERLQISLPRAQHVLTMMRFQRLPEHDALQIEEVLYQHRQPPPASPRWHATPEGQACCCTAQDRRYGIGCS
jgi:hypothetical protein